MAYILAALDNGETRREHREPPPLESMRLGFPRTSVLLSQPGTQHYDAESCSPSVVPPPAKHGEATRATHHLYPTASVVSNSARAFRLPPARPPLHSPRQCTRAS